MNEAQIKLTTEILVYLSKGLCRNFTQKDYNEVDYLNKKYSSNTQYQAQEGAIISHFFISAFERITSSLLLWKIIKPIKNKTGLFVMQIAADEISKTIEKHQCLDIEMFNRVIESFFDYDFQVGWGRCSRHNSSGGILETKVEISKDLITSFEFAGLVYYENNDLVWHHDMHSYFQYTLGGWPTKEKDTKILEAEEFFQQICIENYTN